MLADLPRLKVMAARLKIEVDHGRIDDAYAEEFICSVYDRLFKSNSMPSAKQIAYLESLFERY